MQSTFYFILLKTNVFTLFVQIKGGNPKRVQASNRYSASIYSIFDSIASIYFISDST